MWLKLALSEIAFKRGRDANDLLIDAFIEKYPEARIYREKISAITQNRE